MTATLAHRGPDDQAQHVAGEIGLGFRLLAVIDVGGGRQPLANEDQSVWLVFDGELSCRLTPQDPARCRRVDEEVSVSLQVSDTGTRPERASVGTG